MCGEDAPRTDPRPGVELRSARKLHGAGHRVLKEAFSLIARCGTEVQALKAENAIAP